MLLMLFHCWLPRIHPNGFWIAILATLGGWRLRLHYWPPDSVKLDTSHDHRSWFLSLPLWGILEEHRFEEAPGDELQILNCNSTTRRAAGPLTSPAGLGSVRKTRRRFRLPFIPYFCPVNAIHSTLPRTRRVVTLCLFGSHRKVPRAWVDKKYGKYGQEVGEHSRATPGTHQEARKEAPLLRARSDLQQWRTSLKD